MHILQILLPPFLHGLASSRAGFYGFQLLTRYKILLTKKVKLYFKCKVTSGWNFIIKFVGYCPKDMSLRKIFLKLGIFGSVVAKKPDYCREHIMLSLGNIVFVAREPDYYILEYWYCN